MAPELLNPRGLLTNIASASLVLYSKLDLLRVPCTVAYSYVYIYLYEVETASDEIPSTNEAYAFKY